MKAVMQAIWLMVVAFGNLIDIIVIAIQSGATGEGMSQVSFSSCTANYHDFSLKFGSNFDLNI
jgi:hypothetical protein